MDHFTGVIGEGNGITHFYFFGILDTGYDITHIAAAHFFLGFHTQFQDTYFIGTIILSGRNKANHIAFAQYTIQNTVVHDDTAETIEYRIEDQSLKRCFLTAFRSRNAFHNSFDTDAGFTAGQEDIFLFAANQINDLVGYFRNHGTFHINLVDHRNDLQIVIDGQIEVTDGLCLNTLRRIYQQQGAFACSQCTAHFIAEVNVAGCINQVQYVFLPFVRVINLNGVTLNGNALFPLQIHVVQYLVHHVALTNGLGMLQQSVGQGTLSVVNMGDDAKIPDMLHKCAKISVCTPNYSVPISNTCEWERVYFWSIWLYFLALVNWDRLTVKRD